MVEEQALYLTGVDISLASLGGRDPEKFKVAKMKF